MKVIIAGGRDFKDYRVLKDACKYYLKNQKNVVVLSGHCQGADMLGERFAEEYGYEIEVFPANWKTFGKAAGPIRNSEMIEKADALIIFWDGQSRGSKDIISKAHTKGIKIKEIRFK